MQGRSSKKQIAFGLIVLPAFLFLLPAERFTEEPESPQEECKKQYIDRIEQLSVDESDPASTGIMARKSELLSENVVREAVSKCVAALNKNEPDKTNPDSDSNQNKDPAKTDEGARKAEPAECKQSYEHLLTIYATSDLASKPDGKKLIESWKTESARTAFHNRCTRVFRKQDVDCLLSSQESDYIRACLLIIPAG